MSLELFPYQVEGVKTLIKNSRFLLADEQGLGKTVQAICACKALDLKKILVICPAFLKPQWEAEFKLWYPARIDVRVESYNYIQKKENVNRLKKYFWNVVIADECQRIGKWTAVQTKNFVLSLAFDAPRVWLLSGTPSTKSAADWHSIYTALDPEYNVTPESFYNKFCFKKEFNVSYRGRGGKLMTKKITEFKGYKNEEELRALIKPFILRRLKKDVAPNLPPKLFSTVIIDTGVKYLPLNAKTLKKDVEAGEPTGNLAKLRREVGNTKIPVFFEWFDFDDDSQAIIFCWHRDNVKEVLSGFIERGLKAESMLGGDLTGHRERVQQEFREGKIQYLVLSIAACEVGLNLEAAKRCVFLELPWSAASYDQCWSRMERVTTKHDSLFIYTLIAEGSMDTHVMDVITQKRIKSEKVING